MTLKQARGLTSDWLQVFPDLPCPLSIPGHLRVLYSVAENRSFCVGSEEEAVGSRADQAAVRVRAGRERAGM